MFIEYPYRGHDNPAIHWDYAEAISANIPVAVEVNDASAIFSDEALASSPEQRLVLAEYVCGRTGGMTARRVGQLPGNRGRGYDVIHETYAQLGVDYGGGGAAVRGREKLVAQAHRAGILESDHHPLSLPEDWQRPFRDLLLALISEKSLPALGEILQIKSISRHLDEATRRTIQQLGLGHLERGGPTLVTLGAGLLPATEEELQARIVSPLTEKEQAFFDTLPPIGGAPLLPYPQLKTSTPPVPTESAPNPIPPLVVVTPEPPPRRLPPTYESQPRPEPATTLEEGQGLTKSLIVRPSELADSFGNDTIWWRVDGQPLDAQKANLHVGRIGLIGIQGAEVEIVATQHEATQLGISESSVFYARISGLTVPETVKVVGINKRAQAERLPVTLRAAFRDPQLFRTVKPPKFEGLEREYGLLMEFGQLLIQGGTRRSFLYEAAKRRESLSYPKKEALIAGVDADMKHLRRTLSLNTLGLAFLYLATMDYEKQVAEQIEDRRQGDN